MLQNNLLTVKEASIWASGYLHKNVTTSNISYLVNYGKITKYGDNGTTQVSQNELIKYYASFMGQREIDWREKLGDDLNWALSFDYLKEADTTKHIHRLHPYKGKFIPQLVAYFLDTHTDNFKKEVYFKDGDIVLDPFAGSGTTLVQANELNLHAIGIDVSAFNAFITNCKIADYDLENVQQEYTRISAALKQFIEKTNTPQFEEELLQALYKFNNQYFPVPEFKARVQKKLIDGERYGQEKARLFLPTYQKLVADYQIKLLQPQTNNFLEKWFSEHVRQEIDFVFAEIKKIKNRATKKILGLILSRTMRSCRATTHADLATLKEPVITTYYCAKHGKICKPLFSILKWWETYCQDTLRRLRAFAHLRTETQQFCLTGDSRKIDLFAELAKKNADLFQLAKQQKIKGIFSSPPYVGLIDYHEQHAYAYDLFGFKRSDELEIGALCKGQSKAAQENYVQGVSEVLNNCKKYLADDFDVFLVSNDKYGLYPRIAEKAEMQIVNQFKRPVLNRTEKDKGAYAEIIFHLKGR